MKRLKTYESFGSSEFNPQMITEQEYTRVKKSGIHLRFSARDVARIYHNSGFIVTGKQIGRASCRERV